MADSGIYLRGTAPGADLGLEPGLRPQEPHPQAAPGLGRAVQQHAGHDRGAIRWCCADRPFGEWNQFRIRQIGDRTWVWLNDQLVVDGAAGKLQRPRPAIPAKGPIQLQTHGGEIRWRNIFVRDISPEEGKADSGGGRPRKAGPSGGSA